MTATHRHALLALVPALTFAPLWASSYRWCVTGSVLGRHAYVALQSLRGDLQLGMETNSVGWLPGDRFGCKFEPVPSHPNDHSVREWTFAGFGYAWDEPSDVDPARVRYSLVGVPHWFAYVVLLCPPAAILWRGRRKPASSPAGSGAATPAREPRTRFARSEASPEPAIPSPFSHTARSHYPGRRPAG